MATRDYYEGLTRQTAAARLSTPAQQRAWVNMIRQESDNFSPDVAECRRVSSAGAEGIGQIMRQFHPTVDPCDPPAALNYSAELFKAWSDRYGGNLRKGAAAYNAGPGTVDRLTNDLGDAWEQGLPAETKQYLDIVFREEAPPMPSVRPLWHDPATGWYLPATPPVTGRWNPPAHYGVDIGGGGKRSPILSVTDGVVIFTGWWNRQSQPVNDRTGFGLTVMIRSDHHIHLYGHNDEITVSIGDVVVRGQQLAFMGNTGYVEPIGGGDGSHLHYQVHPGQGPSDVNNGTAIDPTPWLELGAVRWRGITLDGVRLRSLPAMTDAAGNDTTLTILPMGTPLFVPDSDDVRIPVVASGRRGWVSVPYVELEGMSQPPPLPPPLPPDAECERLRASAIRAWTKRRDTAAYHLESATVSNAMQREAEERDIAEALAELRALGVP